MLRVRLHVRLHVRLGDWRLDDSTLYRLSA